MATLTVKNLTTASGQDLALRTGGTDRLTISSSDGSVTIGGGLALGPTPASSGYLRIPNSQYITARNAANTGNINLIGLNSSNQVVFGTGLNIGDQSIINVYSISQTNSNNWNISNAGAATFAGTLNLTGAGAQLYVGNTNTSTEACLIQIGNGRTGSGQSYIDFIGDTTYTDFGMRLSRDGGASGSSYIQHRGTGDLALLGQDACAISLRTNNTERFRINSDGTACLNTSNTVSNVAQTIVTRSGETINTVLLGRSYGGSCSLGLQATGGTEAIPSATTTSTNPVNIVAGTTSDGTTFINTASINIGVESTPTSTSHPTFFAISTTPSASTTRVERFRINSSGNVGIGTTSPSENLHIKNSAPRIRLEDSDGASASIFSMVSGNTAATGSIHIQADPANAGTGSYVAFDVDGATKMILDDTGVLSLKHAGPGLNIGDTNTSTQSCYLQIGNGRTGDGGSYIDLVGDATYTDYGLRIIRNSTANGISEILHRGTGDLRISTTDSSQIQLRTANVNRIALNNTPQLAPNTDNSLSLGGISNRWVAVYAVNGTIQTSDARQKHLITNSVLGLEFIKSLRPVSYKWNVGENIVEKVKDEDGNDIIEEDGSSKVTIVPKPGERTHWGLIAQEVKVAADAAGVDFGGWILGDKENPDSEQGLRYDQFIAPLIKAVQELSVKVQLLESKLEEK